MANGHDPKNPPPPAPGKGTPPGGPGQAHPDDGGQAPPQKLLRRAAGMGGAVGGAIGGIIGALIGCCLCLHNLH
ncbi:MAG TPA: hypothetical protein VN815_07395 [Steroidobacteraceae bacterium]|jgi:hypothetical protein|nr:hypothetical protein [Steroidobacteraceae bacterium]